MELGLIVSAIFINNISQLRIYQIMAHPMLITVMRVAYRVNKGVAMKRLILVTMLFLMTMIAGCGELLPASSDYLPPKITTYHHTQDVLNSYVDGTLEFYAPDSDLDTITISVVNSRGTEIEHTITYLSSFAGRSSEAIYFTIDYINYRPDDYTYTIYLTDRAGYMSNPVYGAFRV
jgi:hypothetical protein